MTWAIAATAASILGLVGLVIYWGERRYAQGQNKGYIQAQLATHRETLEQVKADKQKSLDVANSTEQSFSDIDGLPDDELLSMFTDSAQAAIETSKDNHLTSPAQASHDIGV